MFRKAPSERRAGTEGRITVSSISHRRWPYGSDGCQAHGFQGFAAALASICNSAAIAWGSYHHYCTRMFGAPRVVGHPPCGEYGWDEDLLSVSQFRGVWVGVSVHKGGVWAVGKRGRLGECKRSVETWAGKAAASGKSQVLTKP